MITAAINPETGEFLGIIIPAADLGQTITIFGGAAEWESLMRGRIVPKWKVGVIFSNEPPTVTADTESVVTYAIDPVEVDNLTTAGAAPLPQTVAQAIERIHDDIRDLTEQVINLGQEDQS